MNCIPKMENFVFSLFVRRNFSIEMHIALRSERTHNTKMIFLHFHTKTFLLFAPILWQRFFYFAFGIQRFCLTISFPLILIIIIVIVIVCVWNCLQRDIGAGPPLCRIQLKVFGHHSDERCRQKATRNSRVEAKNGCKRTLALCDVYRFEFNSLRIPFGDACMVWKLRWGAAIEGTTRGMLTGKNAHRTPNIERERGGGGERVREKWMQMECAHKKIALAYKMSLGALV